MVAVVVEEELVAEIILAAGAELKKIGVQFTARPTLGSVAVGGPGSGVLNLTPHIWSLI